MIDDLGRRLGVAVSGAPFESVASAAASLSWTRDPFDRLIVGHADADESPLLTKDATLRSHYAAAVWD